MDKIVVMLEYAGHITIVWKTLVKVKKKSNQSHRVAKRCNMSNDRRRMLQVECLR
jgi:hypothetical protein